GTGTIDPAALVEGRPIGELLARRFVRGISADLVPSDFELFGDGDASTLNPDEPTRRAIVHKAELGGLTIIPVPAFGDCTVELAATPAENMPADMPAVDPTELGLAASAFPAWRSAEVGDCPALVAAGEEHTGGMIALVPANAAELAVDGGLPPDELLLTLAYLGDDVTRWPAARRDSLIQAMRAHAERVPITARVMAHAQFNPDGGPDGDRDPCAVYLIGDSTEIGPLRSAVMTEVDEDEDLPEQHEPPIFHITAGYGVESGALTFTGPIVFDRIAVVLGPDWTYIPLGAEAAEPPASTDEETVMAAAPPDPADGLDDEPMETGMPDAPQPCPLGEGDEHPAVRSLLYAGGEQYVPTCREHEEEARGMVEAEGDEVSRVVEIREPDRLDAEEQEETS
ncbi:MAG: hypothetical protein L0I24_23105, partial [Pseudonocardia sp.]|nr:hypothetical protein [Pseudonocardia sp.]